MSTEIEYLSSVRDRTIEEKIKLILRQAPSSDQTLKSTFLPSLPPDDIQVSVAGKSGYGTLREAFDFIETAKRHYTELSPGIFSPQVLDFGCGWGRLCQAWSTYTLPSNVIGCDVRDFIVEIAKQHAPMQKFIISSPLPPLNAESGSFEIVTAYSVFSHLSDVAASLWIEEFNRILKPGGMAFITTRPRAHLLQSRSNFEKMAKNKTDELNSHDIIYASMFSTLSDFDNAIMRYDKGEFVYVPTGGGKCLDKSFYGESIVPLNYVAKKWAGELLLINWVPFFSEYGYQPMIVLRKKF